jgi:uracil-DNA glycosylase family 4
MPSTSPAALDPNPPRDCPLCPRLVTFREEARHLHPDWFNAPVPNWGDPDPKLIIVGLAPGLRGANRTGRPFTGDYAGDTLYDALLRHGLATGEYRADPDDGLMLRGVLIANGVHCVPPENKPTTTEIRTCRRYLEAAFARYSGVRGFLALGRIAHEQLLAALGERRARYPFGHGAEHRLADGRHLFDSYHCSRYNTNTGVLTVEMFDAVIARAARFIAEAS